MSVTSDMQHDRMAVETILSSLNKVFHAEAVQQTVEKRKLSRLWHEGLVLGGL